MESMGDLILKAHFTELRNSINKGVSVDEVTGAKTTVETLKKVDEYFHNLKNKGLLDAEGLKLHEELIDTLQLAAKPQLHAKMPMEKAGKKRGSKGEAKSA